MKIEELQDKEGNKLVTKEGVTMTRKTFEPGDEFICMFDVPMENRKTVQTESKGEQVITEHKIKAQVRDSEGHEYTDNGVNEHFIELTPTQSKKLKELADNGTELTQNVFKAYSYMNDYGEQVGVGLKRNRKRPVTFGELEPSGTAPETNNDIDNDDNDKTVE